jgi:glc operon protein GlcG
VGVESRLLGIAKQKFFGESSARFRNAGETSVRNTILVVTRGKTNMVKHPGLVRAALILTVAAAAFAFGSVDARAQGATPAPFNKVTVSDEVAKRTLMKAVINADTARAIVNACVEWQKAQPGNGSIVIFVLSPTGEIIDSHQMDGVLPIGAETGLMKAKTALYARASSASVAQRFNTVDGRLIRLDLGKEQGLSYYFVPGGLPIVVDNQLIGAVGVGGGSADEQCAYQALVKVLGPQPPLAQAPPPPAAAPMPGQQPQR